MKTKLTFLILFIAVSSAIAQNVKIKKDKILVDGKHFLNYEKINTLTHSIYDKEDNEFLFVSLKDNETPGNIDDDYYILHFIDEKIKVESADKRIYTFMSFSSKKVIQKIIKWLIKDKVITNEGTINKEKLNIFHSKYNEDITNRTIRY